MTSTDASLNKLADKDLAKEATLTSIIFLLAWITVVYTTVLADDLPLIDWLNKAGEGKERNLLLTGNDIGYELKETDKETLLFYDTWLASEYLGNSVGVVTVDSVPGLRERAGGWISAGMISTVQTPLPILAQVAPKICAHFCAPSPEFVMISTVCSDTSLTLTAGFVVMPTLTHSDVGFTGPRPRRRPPRQIVYMGSF